MKVLIASVIALVILISAWGLFYRDSRSFLRDMAKECGDRIIAEIEAGNWEEASASAEKQYALWKRYRKKALLFLNTADVNEIHCTFARAVYYIKAEDASNSTGELCALASQLAFLMEREKANLRNIL